MSLAEDLVTTAAQAIRDAYEEDCGIPMCDRPVLDVVEWSAEGRAVVVAILEVLAAKPDGFLRHQEDGGITYTKTLRKLAEEMRGG